MPQPVTYNPGTPVSGSIQENNISYVVDGQNRNYRGGFGGLSWMSEVPAANNVIFIGNSTSLGRGPANIPLFYPSYNNSSANIVYTANTLPGSPRNFTTTGSAYNWAVTNNFVINNSDNPIPRIDADGLALYLDASQPTSYPQINNTWYDLSGNGYNGTLTNGPTWNSNGWFQFDGVDDYITTPLATTSGQALTIVGVLYSTETTANYRNFYDSVTQKPMIWWDASGRIEFDAASFTTSAVYRNKWTLVALSKPAGNSSPSYYVNGELVGSGTAYTVPSLTPTWFNRAAAEEWLGNAQLVNFYSRALTTTEIKQNYFQSNIVQDGLVLMADASNLVSYPKSGTTTYNLTGSLTGSLLNGVGFTQENGGNWTFDGVDDRISFQSPFGDVDWGTTAFTVTGWIKVDSPNDNDWCLLSSATNSNLIFGTLPYPAGNSLYVYGLRNSLGSPNNQVFNFFASNLWPNGYFRDTWLHVTLTYNGNGLSLGNFAIYSNGVSRTLNNGGSAGYSNANVIQLGRSTYGTGPTEYPNLMVYNRALTATEVQQNYQATKDKFQGQQIVTNGLQLNYDFANKDSYSGTGTTVYDLSGNGNNGTLVNNPQFSFNANSGVISWDGTDDYIDTGKTATQLGFYNANYTMEAWVYPTSITSDRTMFGTDQGAIRQGLHLVFRGGNIYQGHFGSDFTAGTVTTNNWYQIVYTYNASTGACEIFKNSVSQGTGTIGSFIGTTNILIARWLSVYYFEGPGGIYRIYNRVLTSTEVLQNYNATKTRFGL